MHYWEFLPPASDLPTSFPSTERNVEVALAYSDAWTGWAVTFNPYAKFWFHTSGPSNVVLGERSGTYDVELGLVPTGDLKKYWGLPITLTAPTWVTVGPTECLRIAVQPAVRLEQWRRVCDRSHRPDSARFHDPATAW